MILDTNALTALGDGDAELRAFLVNIEPPVLCFVSHAEYLDGLLGSKRPEEGLALLDALQSTVRTLQTDSETPRYYAEIRQALRKLGKPIPTNDIWIAALARQHSLPILSRDQHFDFVPGVERVGW